MIFGRIAELALGLAVLGVEGYIQSLAIASGQVSVLPIPAGSNIIVQPGTPRAAK